MEGAQERFILDKGRLAFLMPPVCLFLQGALHVPAALCPRPQLPSSREKPPRSAVMGGGLLAPRGASSCRAPTPRRCTGMQDSKTRVGTGGQSINKQARGRQRVESVPPCTERGHRSKEEESSYK